MAWVFDSKAGPQVYQPWEVVDLMIARFAALSAVYLLGGCAWYAPGSEHYFGPVFFRYSETSERSTLVAEIVRPAAAGEGGWQWGLTVGVAQRLVVAAQDSCVDDDKSVP